MSNTIGIRNLKTLCDQGQNRDAYELAKHHLAEAEVFNREIGELARKGKEYEHLAAVLRPLISMAAAPLNKDPGFGLFRGDVSSQEKQRTAAREGLNKSFKEMEEKLIEIQHHVSIVAVGINTLRG